MGFSKVPNLGKGKGYHNPKEGQMYPFDFVIMGGFSLLIIHLLYIHQTDINGYG
jgi:hypothetical protein